ncbi:hypothetical protein J2Z47_004646 [Cohnella thailandensis]|nr:hypothetical protein [Cohnella thailandensis]
MEFLLPATTFVLVILGAFCLFAAMANDRRSREMQASE